MRNYTRTQGALEVLSFPARLLAAILLCCLMQKDVSAQGNSAAQPSNQPGTSQVVQLEGEIEILYQDFANGHSSYGLSLKLANGSRVPLNFKNHVPTHLLTGDRVRVSGQMSGGSLMLYSNPTKTNGSGGTTAIAGDATGTQSSSIPVPNTFGAQSTLVLLVNFQDNAIQPFSTSDAFNAVFGTANNYIVENSYGQTSLGGNVAGWYTIPVSAATCDLSQIATAAQNAATGAGVNLSAYTRYVYAFPQNSACGFAGSSYVGGNPSESWINGVMNAHTVAHELGHAFGLWHSHLLDCGASATICSGGTIVEYGDLTDTMGSPQSPSPDYNAFQKERLGWLNYGSSPAIQTVQSSGTYNIAPYELGASGPNALKVLKSSDPTSGVKTWYYLESRQALGFDAFLSTSSYYTQNETTGVLFHLGTDGDGNSGDLIDMTPATPTTGNWWDMALAAGQTFQDSNAGVTFTIQSVTSAGAAVNVQFSGANGGSSQNTGSPCSGAPGLAVTANQASYSPGQTVSLSAAASCGGSPAPNVTVSFDVTGPSGKKTTGLAVSGANGVAMYKLKLRQTAPAGTYLAGSAATIAGNPLSAATQFAVQ